MAAILRVQNVATATSAQSANCVLAGVQAGDLLAVCWREHDGASVAGLTVTSSIDGAFTEAVRRVVSAAQVAIYYRKNASAGDHTITVDFGGGALVFDFNASAWGGCVTTGGADQTNSTGGGSTNAFNHGSITPSAAALILTCWGGSADNGGETPGADGMTALTNTADGAAGHLGRQYYQYKVGHTGAIDADFTSADSVLYDACIAAFLETAGGERKWLLVAH